MLSYLLQRLLQLGLEAIGHPQWGRPALQKLESIRLVRNRLGDRVIDCVVQTRPAGADAILKALGLLPLLVLLNS